MKTQTLLYTVLSLLVIGLSVPTVWAASGHVGHMLGQKMTLVQVHEKLLPMTVKSIALIEQAVASGDKQAALTELVHLKAMLAQIKRVVAKEVGPAFVNIKCPIMGAPIHPDKVPASLVREYQGQKVAFCCAGCPAQWDKLNDTQKQAKLKMYEVPDSHASHNH